MTQQEQIEIIQRQFPNVGETELRKRLNNANRRFIRETRIIQDVATTATVADQTDYAFSTFTTSAGGQLIEVFNVDIPDVDNTNLRWVVERNRDTIVIGKLQENDSDNIVLNALTSGGDTIYVYGVFTDAGYGTTLIDTPAYDEEFHIGIVYKVLADLHLENGNIQINDRYEMKYKDVVVSAKRVAGGRGIKGSYRTSTSLNDSPRRVK